MTDETRQAKEGGAEALLERFEKIRLPRALLAYTQRSRKRDWKMSKPVGGSDTAG